AQCLGEADEGIPGDGDAGARGHQPRRAVPSYHQHALFHGQTPKDSPQPHSTWALGLRNLRVALSPSITRSISVPPTSGRAAGSTYTQRSSATRYSRSPALGPATSSSSYL